MKYLLFVNNHIVNIFIAFKYSTIYTNKQKTKDKTKSFFFQVLDGHHTNNQSLFMCCITRILF